MVLSAHSPHATPASTSWSSGQGDLVGQDKISFKEILWWPWLFRPCPVFPHQREALSLWPLRQSPCSKHLQKVLEPTLLFQLTTLSSAHQNKAKDRTLLAGIPQLVCTARKHKAKLAKSSAIYLRQRPGCEEYSARSMHPTYFPYQHDLAPTEIPTAASDPRLGETNRRVRIEPVPVPTLRGALQAATACSA